MIKVYFPSGCYGTYVTRCIYNYTDLRTEPFEELTFTDSGSSHDFWPLTDRLLSTIRFGHTDTPAMLVQADKIVTVLPSQDHRLDYFNNVLFKRSDGNFIDHILHHFLDEDAIYKFKTNWQYNGALSLAPTWMVREWCSFWINDVMSKSYNYTEYSDINSTIQFSAQDIFENWIQTLTETVSALDLKLTVNVDTIDRQHKNFLMVQKSHNSQIRCHQYVSDLLSGINTKMTLHSILDEAYIQHLLRQSNFEIQCDGLDIFPTDTTQLSDLIYETMHHTNT